MQAGRCWLQAVEEASSPKTYTCIERVRIILLPGTNEKTMRRTFMNLKQLFALDPDVLLRLARDNRAAYVQAQPFPHIVLDDLLPAALLHTVIEEFPAPGQIMWIDFDDPAQKKLAADAETQIGPTTRLLLYQLNSSIFISFLEALTGIEGLVPDPYLNGGGLHQIERGGYLKVHADFNWHPRLRLDRRLNVLLYLNEGWKEEYGGHLELWDTDMTRCEQRILPVFNRCVIFSTTDTSYHGHPDPLTCPPGWTRRSLALYYYTNGRPAEEKSDAHSTLFQERPGETIPPSEQAAHLPDEETASGKELAKTVLKKVTPPILLDAWRFLRKRG
jgi:hypothetical protein